MSACLHEAFVTLFEYFLHCCLSSVIGEYDDDDGDDDDDDDDDYDDDYYWEASLATAIGQHY